MLRTPSTVPLEIVVVADVNECATYAFYCPSRDCGRCLVVADVNECATLAFHCPSRDCGRCLVVADVNECASHAFHCPAHSTCVNTPGSYKCRCDSGYKTLGRYCHGSSSSRITTSPLCLFCELISRTTPPIFANFLVHVTYGRGSALLWRRCDM